MSFWFTAWLSLSYTTLLWAQSRGLAVRLGALDSLPDARREMGLKWSGDREGERFDAPLRRDVRPRRDSESDPLSLSLSSSLEYRPLRRASKSLLLASEDEDEYRLCRCVSLYPSPRASSEPTSSAASD